MEVEELAKSNRETEILVQAMATRKFSSWNGFVLYENTRGPVESLQEN